MNSILHVQKDKQNSAIPFFLWNYVIVIVRTLTMIYCSRVNCLKQNQKKVMKQNITFSFLFKITLIHFFIRNNLSSTVFLFEFWINCNWLLRKVAANKRNQSHITFSSYFIFLRIFDFERLGDLSLDSRH